METLPRQEEGRVPPCVLLAFELSQRCWKLGFSGGVGQRPRLRQMPAGAVEQLGAEIRAAQLRFGGSVDTPVVSCYEAGREGFWLHRYLIAHGVQNYVVDSSSIEVNRRARRAKTDRLDLGGLLTSLARYVGGDPRVWRVVRVPTSAEEDARHLPRTLETVAQDRTRVINRLKALLTTQGLQVPLAARFAARLEAARLWDGTPVPSGCHARLLREWTHLQQVQGHLRDLKRRQLTDRPDPATPTGHAIAQLQGLRAIGPGSAWVLATEIFGWRQIRNRRQLAALVGLVPAPYQSGDTQYDQGISRAGNVHVRRLIVELAWAWLRYQPQSALTQWYHHRFGHGGTRIRRIGIVALARKLLIALWRYVDQGVLPEGAVLRPRSQ